MKMYNTRNYFIVVHFSVHSSNGQSKSSLQHGKTTVLFCCTSVQPFVADVVFRTIHLRSGGFDCIMYIVHVQYLKKKKHICVN